jgi:hypothetical protein
VWWCINVTPGTERKRQKSSEVKDSLGKVRANLLKKKRKKR